VNDKKKLQCYELALKTIAKMSYKDIDQSRLQQKLEQAVLMAKSTLLRPSIMDPERFKACAERARKSGEKGGHLEKCPDCKFFLKWNVKEEHLYCVNCDAHKGAQ
jgi:hypothetical protein